MAAAAPLPDIRLMQATANVLWSSSLSASSRSRRVDGARADVRGALDPRGRRGHPQQRVDDSRERRAAARRQRVHARPRCRQAGVRVGAVGAASGAAADLARSARGAARRTPRGGAVGRRPARQYLWRSVRGKPRRRRGRRARHAARAGRQRALDAAVVPEARAAVRHTGCAHRHAVAVGARLVAHRAGQRRRSRARARQRRGGDCARAALRAHRRTGYAAVPAPARIRRLAPRRSLRGAAARHLDDARRANREPGEERPQQSTPSTWPRTTRISSSGSTSAPPR